MGNTLEGRKQVRQKKEYGKYINYITFQLITCLCSTVETQVVWIVLNLCICFMDSFQEIQSVQSLISIFYLF